MSDETPELEKDKVKSVHLGNVSTKITGMNDVELGAKALARLKRNQRRPEPVRNEPVEVELPKRRESRGLLGMLSYAYGRFMRSISNLMK